MKQVKLIEAREKAGLTQENVAESVGISRSFYTQIERGNRKPSVKVLLKLAGFFNKNVEDIFLINNVATCDVDNGGCISKKRPFPAA